MESHHGGPQDREVTRFSPTWAEFEDFERYLTSLEERGLVDSGLAIIVPPNG